ncbi:hypothetical protein F5884DRAFT_868967 [Xylogone sp. PMI_703]|nr:hypothetical protein F5884DRAFT_868967 [Xylogone sp. PMI_703]
MVHLDTVRSSNAKFSKRESLVAVFVGGTQGIGEFAIRALTAAYGVSGKGLRLYIVGRNEAAAQKIISDCRAACPMGRFQFVHAKDAALLKDVDRISAEIIKAEELASKTPRIDLLVMTQGYLAFEKRQETPEGLDALMSLLYYSRMRFILQLLPLLLASSPGPSHVISVFSPKRDDKLFANDLSLREPAHYNFMNMGSHVSYMTTFFMEHLAAQHPEQISLIHYYPGIVMTEGFNDPRLPKWFKLVFGAVSPLVRLLTVPKAESGARVIFNASARFPARSKSTEGAIKNEENSGLEIATSSCGRVGGGAYRVDWNGETVPKGKLYKELEEKNMSQKTIDHTMEAFKTIAEGDVFTG